LFLIVCDVLLLGACDYKLSSLFDKQSVMKFELWRSEGRSAGLSFFPAGRKGEQARSMLEANAKLIWTVDALSYMDAMQKYYAYMAWGDYRSEWPDLASIPFLQKDGAEALLALPKKLAAFTRIEIFADGSSKPTIPDYLPMINLHDGKLVHLGVWVQDEFGGSKHAPLNVSELMDEAKKAIEAHCPEYFQSEGDVNLICPSDLFVKMQWPAFS
jgi:hypothetical protein